MKMRYIVAFLIILFKGVSAEIFAQTEDVASAQHAILGQNAAYAGGNYKTRQNTHPDAQWFPKAGLGLFIHLGISAVHGGIDLSWGMYANKSWEDGEISPEEYWRLADRWNPVNFKPEKWAKLAADAGFKYVVFTTKHHDGYTMWPSRYGNLGVKQKLNGRDLVREVVEACRKNGLKIGLYYSPPDWYFDALYINWDYSRKQVLNTRHEPVERLPKKPAGHEAARRELVVNQIKELLTDYGKIDLFFFDGGKGEISNDEIRRMQPGIIINRRNRELGDYADSEGALPKKRFDCWFETNDPCWPSRWWGYSNSDRMDTGDDVLEKLVILRAWGGNFLANVGPKADGAMPEEALEAWKDMALWMKHSGESVFDVEGGGFPSTANQPVTVKGDSVMYAHAFPNFHQSIIIKKIGKTPRKAILLRTGKEIPFSYQDSTLKVSIDPTLRSRHIDTVKLLW